MNKSRSETIVIAQHFTNTPGFRYRTDGPFSGEEFRERFLEPLFVVSDASAKVTIDLDGAAGYATSFLEEAFGELARKYGKKACLSRLVFVSTEDPFLADEIRGYIEDA